MRYLRKGGGEAKEILFAPPKLDYDNETFYNFRVEKDRLIIDRSGFNLIFIVLGGILSLVSINYFRGVGFNPLALGTAWYYVFLKITVDLISLSMIFMFLQGFLGYKKVFIFDREKGTVTYPEFGWFRTKTIPFDDACFICMSVSRYTPNTRILTLIRSNGISSVAISSYKKPLELFSLLVWYMDKNRPLPPGDKFDIFRQEDYDRRKAAGFPMPLYLASYQVHSLLVENPIYSKNSLRESKRTKLSRKERKNKK